MQLFIFQDASRVQFLVPAATQTAAVQKFKEYLADHPRVEWSEYFNHPAIAGKVGDDIYSQLI